MIFGGIGISNLGRDTLINRLNQDLIGPDKEDEILESKPSDVYLTGILWPKKSKIGPEEDENLAVGGNSGNGDNSGASSEEEGVSRSGMNKPSTAGLSFAAYSTNIPSVEVRFCFARYNPEYPEITGKGVKSGSSESQKNNLVWRRIPINESVEISLEAGSRKFILDGLNEEIPEGVFLHVRAVEWEQNKILATVTLVNDTKPDPDDKWLGQEKNTLFQVKVEISASAGSQLVARPSGRKNAITSDDSDERSTSLLYRNAREYATGHTCSAEWDDNAADSITNWIATTWIPETIVPSTSPLGHVLFSKARECGNCRPLSAEWLSGASDEELKKALLMIPGIYQEWLSLQQTKIDDLEDGYREQGEENLRIGHEVLQRMKNGAEMIGNNPDMAEAFRLANRAILLQFRWNTTDTEQFSWRPFQMGFILLTIPSSAERTHPDRTVMDLLWFPTGGGKTEAYLALVAFTIFFRRLSEKGNPDNGAGVTAIMRYTLRLLTTQQFARSSAVILACEAIRRGRDSGTSPDVPSRLGNKPISIGLWVGGGATPNKFEEARKALEPGSNEPSPKQLEYCPACGEKLEWIADQLTRSVKVFCKNPECVLSGTKVSLPVFTVDTDIFRECPSLLVGTIDKFAQIVRNTSVNGLFGVGSQNPPDLIIQDELHLISGPLGTIAGLYETAIDRMLSKDGVGPKIIGSTATIRRAVEQTKALFNRNTCQFPPPAIDADDSGFAVTDYNAAGRKYVGVSTAGRSAKFTLQAISASLLQSATKLDESTSVDYYWTILSYYNSLRELGGALVLMQDDVNQTLSLLAKRHEEEMRKTHEPEELTSRRTQEEIRKMLDKLEISWDEPGALDTVLATNMVSVGVDISRLGLMIVNGQPKSTSEYIQATSRVGRGNVPGLVVTIENNAKPRDRSHFESFPTWHNTLYRDVEATSVTPFAPRARDKALHAVLVSLIRHTKQGMLDSPDINRLSEDDISDVLDYIIKRAKTIDPEEVDVTYELRDLIEYWEDREPDAYFVYGGSGTKHALLQDADYVATMRAEGRKPREGWATMNNMRSVEPSSLFRIVPRLKAKNRQRRV